MRIVVVGAGATGTELTKRLARQHEVCLLDVSEDALTAFRDSFESEDEPTQDSLRRVETVCCDGTSRLQLEKVLDPDQPCALVATSDTEEVNVEVGRIGVELGYEPVITLGHHLDSNRAQAVAGVTTIARGQLLADHIERSLKHRGAVVPTGIGLGRGELVEVRLVATSPVIDRSLKDLAPDRWRVAAIFRGESLIVPTGETTLQVDDRVLLVGDPELLRGVAEYIRLGTPQFPMPYGENVLSLEREGADQQLCREAQAIASACANAPWVRGLPALPRQADDTGEEEEEEERNPDAPERSVAFGSFGDDERLVRLIDDYPGVIVVRPWRRNAWARLTGRRGPDAWLCDSTESPVLFARGTFPFRRILLPVSASELSVDAAEMAIDITRRLSASLTAVNVDLPAYISGHPEEELHFEVVPIRRLCQLYEVPLEYRHHLGNPVKLVLDEAKQHDLVVVARRRRRRDSYFNVDVALRIARRAACSVIVITTGSDAPTRR